MDLGKNNLKISQNNFNFKYHYKILCRVLCGKLAKTLLQRLLKLAFSQILLYFNVSSLKIIH